MICSDNLPFSVPRELLKYANGFSTLMKIRLHSTVPLILVFLMIKFENICEYFGITPQQFFDDGNAYPVQLADLVEDVKKLDAASLEHIAAIVKEMVGNK